MATADLAIDAAAGAPRSQLGRKYLVVGSVLATFLSVLLWITTRPMSESPLVEAASALLRPLIALVALTGVVWLLMVIFRNFAFIRGAVTERYFQTYALDAPAEWVERPTRAYMNLLELPILFYVVTLLMLLTQRFDGMQVSLAWLFVATRTIHAFVYIALNYIPLRFATYFSGVITLGVIWARFAELWIPESGYYFS